jgi:hypothetical protein
MMPKSPQAAVRLLHYLDDGPYFQSIRGDLDELYGEGRSKAWYWRQALIAVAHCFFRDVWTHRLLAVKVLIAAWACMPLYNMVRLFALKILVMGPLDDFGQAFGLDLFATSFDEIPKSLARGVRSDGMAFLVPACAVLILMAWTFGVATGWLVSRLHRPHHRTMVLLYTASMLATVLPNVGYFAVAAYSNQTFGPVFHLCLYSANNTALIAGIIVGGLLRPRREPPQGLNRIARS